MMNLVRPVTRVEAWVLRHIGWVVAAIAAVRLVQGAFTQLAPDEAVYWMWSRHLAAGYFDHPPMIAVLNWLSSHVLGDREIAVRLPAVALAAGTLLSIVWAARMVIADEVAVAMVAMVWVCSPMLAGFGLIFTPDTPAIFFTACGLACALAAARGMEGEGNPAADFDELSRVARRRGAHFGGARRFWVWVRFGVCCGLGMDSKYPVVLLPAAVGMSLLCSRKGRRELRRPGPWAGAIVAGILFGPVVWWNATHHWASFLFQLNHGVNGAGEHRAVAQIVLAMFAGLGGFIAGQALIWTPVLLGISALVLWKYGRVFWRMGEVDRMLWLTGALPLVVFGLAAMKAGRGEINWPALAWVPISLLMGRWTAGGGLGSAIQTTDQTRAGRLGWMRVGWQVALGFTVVVEVMMMPVVLPALVRAGVPMPASMAELTGWDAWGESIAKAADGALIVTNKHQDAAEATFYTPGRPNAWCDSIGTRRTAYDYFDDQPDFAKIDRVLFIGGHLEQFMAEYGYTHAERRRLDVGGDKRKTATASLVWR